MKHHTKLALSILTLFLVVIACSLGQPSPQTESTPFGSASATPAVSQTRANPPPSGDVIDPDALEYLGAFRLPGGEDPPQTFAYGGNAMTFNAPPEWDVIEVGQGNQRRYRIGDVSFDRINGLLYVLELYGEGAKPIIHVWKIKAD